MASLIENITALSGKHAVSGCENEARRFVLERLKNKSFESVKTDSLGSVIAVKKGTDADGKIMVAAYLDECGFIISGITDDGYLKFKTVGEPDICTAISKRVCIKGRSPVKGVIGMKAIHLQTKSERENTVPAKKLFIDVGMNEKKAVQRSIRLGDYAAFDTQCTVSGDIIRGKALERSAASAMLLERLDKTAGNELYFVFAAQHETGMRGASAASRSIEPDAVITVGAAAADDMYKSEKVTVRMGGGVVIPYADKNSCCDRELLDKTEELAKKLKIPYQRAVLKNDFSDSGAFLYGAGGARGVNISIPCRYSKTPVGMMSLKDVTAAELLLGALIDNIDEWVAK